MGGFLKSQQGYSTGKESDGDASNGMSTIFDDGPPVFVPGKKWEWRDPNKVEMAIAAYFHILMLDCV